MWGSEPIKELSKEEKEKQDKIVADIRQGIKSDSEDLEHMEKAEDNAFNKF